MLLLLLLFASSATGEVPNCYQEGVTWNHDDNALEIHVGVETLNECQRLCKNNENCQNSTWNTPDDPNHPLLCVLFATTRHPVDCKFCVSGPWNCPTCSKKMACDSVDDNLLEVVTGIDTEVECQMKCADTPTCTNYTWYAADNIYSQDCFLFSSCNQVDDTCPHCFTGPPVCPETNTTTSPVCSTPPSTPHGTWHCRTSPDKKNYMECNLDCEPGYIHSGRIATNCSSGTWSTPLGEMTCPAAVALVTGGKSAEKSVEIYSSDGSCNRDLPELPDDRKDHTIDNVDGDILLCGGSNVRQMTSCLKMSENSTMVHHSTTTGKRQFHSSVVMGGQLTLLGGGNTSLTTTEFISPSLSSTWTEGYPLMEDTEGACAVKLTWDTFLVTGGYHNRNHVVLYNITDGTRRRLKNDLNYGRWGHGCTLVQNETYTGVMVAGGYRYDDHTYIRNSTELLDVTKLEGGTWVKAGRLNIPRSELSIVVLGDKILAMGGSDGVQLTNNGHSISSVEQYNLSTFSWSYTKPLLQARGWHAVTTVPATMFECDKD